MIGRGSGTLPAATPRRFPGSKSFRPPADQRRTNLPAPPRSPPGTYLAHRSQGSAAYAGLQRTLLALPHVDGAAAVWGQTLLGEIAHRHGDSAAEGHFRAALSAGDKDLYLLGAYCDWLLDQGRAVEVIPLLQNETRIDPLLLRLALAQQALKRPEAAASIETLRARFEASHARGDTVHQRENARLELFLRGDPRSALPYAVANWQVQREPTDLRILAEAAAAANDATALETVRRWLAETGLEYEAVAVL